MTEMTLYGVGLAYRPCLHQHVMRYRQEIDLLEIPTEDYIVRRRRLAADPEERLLKEAMAHFPVVAHGISMSIGSVEPLDEEYMDGTVKFLERHGIGAFSEHLAYHRIDGVDLTMFLSMPFEQSSLDWLARNYHAARERLGRPFGLENVSYYYPVPDCALDEAEFLTRLTEMTDCTLLLDVTNIYNNATNHGYDPVQFIERLPGERVSQLHIAGGHYSHGMWQDSHSAPVMKEVWGLVDDALRLTAANSIILERDSNFTPFEHVMRDIRQARWIFERHRPRPTNGAAGNGWKYPEPPAADPRAEDLRDLRNFQRASIREITDTDFRHVVESDVSVAEREYPMSLEWRNRWRHSDRQRIDQLSKKWEWIERDAEEDDKRYADLEWQAWVHNMGR